MRCHTLKLFCFSLHALFSISWLPSNIVTGTVLIQKFTFESSYIRKNIVYISCVKMFFVHVKVFYAETQVTSRTTLLELFACTYFNYVM
jgi:hypothetical protein